MHDTVKRDNNPSSRPPKGLALTDVLAKRLLPDELAKLIAEACREGDVAAMKLATEYTPSEALTRALAKHLRADSYNACGYRPRDIARHADQGHPTEVAASAVGDQRKNKQWH